MSKRYILDSYAILALLGGEAGGVEVKTLIEQAQANKLKALMSWVNVGEVAYIVERRWGKEKVHQVLGLLESIGITFVDAGRELALRAAEIKAHHPLAYADAYAAALALYEGGILLTGDPEFLVLDKMVNIQWLPQKAKSGA